MVPASGELVLTETRLACGGRLRGRVELTTGGPNTKALVVLTLVDPSNPAVKTRRVDTDANGRFEFESLEAGEYRIGVGPVDGLSNRHAIKTMTPILVSIAAGEVKELDL